MFSDVFHLLISSVSPSHRLLLSHKRMWGILITSSYKTAFSSTNVLYLVTAQGYQRTVRKKNHSMRRYRIFSPVVRCVYKHMCQRNGSGRSFGNRTDHHAWSSCSVWSSRRIWSNHWTWLLFYSTVWNNENKAFHRRNPKGLWRRGNKHEFLGHLLFSGNLVENSVALLSYLH